MGFLPAEDAIIPSRSLCTKLRKEPLPQKKQITFLYNNGKNGFIKAGDIISIQCRTLMAKRDK